MLTARITLPHFSVSSAMNLPKSAGETDEHRAAQVGKPRLHFGIGEASVDLLVELVDDLGRRVLRCADAEPGARLVARHELAHGREVWQRLRARRGGYCERAQRASPDVLDRRRSAGEHDLHLPAEQIGKRGPAAAIGHMNHVDARPSS